LSINGRTKRVFKFDSTYTVKKTSGGAYILRGEYTFFSYYLSRVTPLKIPPDDHNIFIPTITENYDAFIEDIKRNINCC
jgi:hypothetical protein